MARNYYYSKEEDERLLRLMDDNPDKTNKELGDMAVAYGMLDCKRTASAVAMRIGRLMREQQGKDDDEEEQIDFDKQIMLNRIESFQAERDGLLDVLIGEATLQGDGRTLYLNLREINKYLRKKYPAEYEIRVEELKGGKE